MGSFSLSLCLVVALCFMLNCSIKAFSTSNQIVAVRRPFHYCKTNVNRGPCANTKIAMTEMEDDMPSDTSLIIDDEPSEQPDEDATLREKIKSEIFAIAATTSRGQTASSDEKDMVIDLVYQLEAMNPSTTTNGEKCFGTWELIYSDVEPFRSSPFFMAVRDIFGDDDERASNAFMLHRLATSTSEIGKVRQIIEAGSLTSEVDLKVGTLPSIPFAVTGTVISTASLTPSGEEGYEVTVETTKVENSNVLKFLDGLVEVPVKAVFERLRGSTPSVALNTYYLDDTLRISRSSDEHFFVYLRR